MTFLIGHRSWHFSTTVHCCTRCTHRVYARARAALQSIATTTATTNGTVATCNRRRRRRRATTATPPHVYFYVYTWYIIIFSVRISHNFMLFKFYFHRPPLPDNIFSVPRLLFVTRAVPPPFHTHTSNTHTTDAHLLTYIYTCIIISVYVHVRVTWDIWMCVCVCVVLLLLCTVCIYYYYYYEQPCIYALSAGGCQTVRRPICRGQTAVKPMPIRIHDVYTLDPFRKTHVGVPFSTTASSTSSSSSFFSDDRFVLPSVDFTVFKTAFCL